MQTACLIYSQLDVTETMTTKTSVPYQLFTQTSVVRLTGHKWRQCNSAHKWPSTKVSNTSPFRIMENATLDTMLRKDIPNMSRVLIVWRLTKSQDIKWAKRILTLFIGYTSLLTFKTQNKYKT